MIYTRPILISTQPQEIAMFRAVLETDLVDQGWDNGGVVVIAPTFSDGFAVWAGDGTLLQRRGKTAAANGLFSISSEWRVQCSGDVALQIRSHKGGDLIDAEIDESGITVETTSESIDFGAPRVVRVELFKGFAVVYVDEMVVYSGVVSSWAAPETRTQIQILGGTTAHDARISDAFFGAYSLPENAWQPRLIPARWDRHSIRTDKRIHITQSGLVNTVKYRDDRDLDAVFVGMTEQETAELREFYEAHVSGGQLVRIIEDEDAPDPYLVRSLETEFSPVVSASSNHRYDVPMRFRIINDAREVVE